MWRPCIPALLLASVLLTGISQPAATGPDSRPAIVFFLVDDLGSNDVGWREGSDLQAATPAINDLVSRGVKLERHYVAPLCSPTRSQLLTGRYVLRLGVQAGVFQVRQVGSLPLVERTIAEELKEVAGYGTTALVGKVRAPVAEPAPIR